MTIIVFTQISADVCKGNGSNPMGTASRGWGWVLKMALFADNRHYHLMTIITVVVVFSSSVYGILCGNYNMHTAVYKAHIMPSCVVQYSIICFCVYHIMRRLNLLTKFVTVIARNRCDENVCVHCQ